MAKLLIAVFVLAIASPVFALTDAQIKRCNKTAELVRVMAVKTRDAGVPFEEAAKKADVIGAASGYGALLHGEIILIYGSSLSAEQLAAESFQDCILSADETAKRESESESDEPSSDSPYQTCASIAHLAEGIAQQRDAGLSEIAAIKRAEQRIGKAADIPESDKKDQVADVTMLIDDVYSKRLSSSETRKTYLHDCLIEKARLASGQFRERHRDCRDAALQGGPFWATLFSAVSSLDLLDLDGSRLSIGALPASICGFSRSYLHQSDANHTSHIGMIHFHEPKGAQG